MPDNLRSFVLVCQELGIPNLDYYSQTQIRGCSVEEWANLTVDEFEEKTKFLTLYERETLLSHLSKCEKTLQFPSIAGGLHWKD